MLYWTDYEPSLLEKAISLVQNGRQNSKVNSLVGAAVVVTGFPIIRVNNRIIKIRRLRGVYSSSGNIRQYKVI